MSTKKTFVPPKRPIPWKYVLMGLLGVAMIVIGGGGLLWSAWLETQLAVQENKLLSCRGKPPLPTVNLSVGAQTVQAEVTRTADEEQCGLMFRTNVPRGTGMLFPYPGPGLRKFWMHHTLIPLDILYFDGQRRLKHVEANAKPCPDMGKIDVRTCPSMGADGIQYVLELDGGEVARLGIKPGDLLVLPDRAPSVTKTSPPGR